MPVLVELKTECRMRDRQSRRRLLQANGVVQETILSGATYHRQLLAHRSFHQNSSLSQRSIDWQRIEFHNDQWRYQQPNADDRFGRVDADQLDDGTGL